MSPESSQTLSLFELSSKCEPSSFGGSRTWVSGDGLSCAASHQFRISFPVFFFPVQGTRTPPMAYGVAHALLLLQPPGGGLGASHRFVTWL